MRPPATTRCYCCAAAGGHEILSAKGIPLGAALSEKQAYENKQITIQADDVLILYTDGVTEAVNPKTKKEFWTLTD